MLRILTCVCVVFTHLFDPLKGVALLVFQVFFIARLMKVFGALRMTQVPAVRAYSTCFLHCWPQYRTFIHLNDVYAKVLQMLRHSELAYLLKIVFIWY